MMRIGVDRTTRDNIQTRTIKNSFPPEIIISISFIHDTWNYFYICAIIIMLVLNSLDFSSFFFFLFLYPFVLAESLRLYLHYSFVYDLCGVFSN